MQVKTRTICKDRKEQGVRRCFLVMLAGMVLVIILLYFADGISGNDYWWHVKTGEWIVNHGRVPETDLYSWVGTEEKIAWTPHEWLSEVCFYGIRQMAGDEGVYVFCVAGAILLNFILLRANRERLLHNCIFTLFFYAFFAAVSGNFCYGRPHFFTFFLLFAELHCLYAYLEHPGSNGLYQLPVIGFLWGNLHAGSAPLSYLLPILLLISGIWDICLGRLYSCKFGKKELRKLVLVILLTMVSICINPLGLKALTYPYTQIGQELQMRVISEWGAPDIKQTGQLVIYFIPVFLTIMGVVLTEKRIRVYDMLIMGLFGYLFLRSQRFIMFYYISAAFWAFRYTLPVKIKEKIGRPGKILVVVCLGGILAAVCVGIVSVGKQCTSGQCISMELPEEMVELIKQEKPERLFNDYDYGGELIFHDIAVFFDGRADVYSEGAMLSDGVSLLFLQQMDQKKEDNSSAVIELLEYYGFDGILVRESRPLYGFLCNCQEKYELLFETGGAAYFKLIQEEQSAESV